jgi:hypothetical protein
MFPHQNPVWTSPPHIATCPTNLAIHHLITWIILGDYFWWCSSICGTSYEHWRTYCR